MHVNKLNKRPAKEIDACRKDLQKRPIHVQKDPQQRPTKDVCILLPDKRDLPKRDAKDVCILLHFKRDPQKRPTKKSPLSCMSPAKETPKMSAFFFYMSKETHRKEATKKTWSDVCIITR